MNQSSTIRTPVLLAQSTSDSYFTSFPDDVMQENVTLTTEDEILKRIWTFMTYSIITHSVRVYFTVPVINFVIGLPGSIVSFLVIFRMKPFTSSSLYFCALAVADGLFVAFVMLFTYSNLSPTELNAALCPIAEGIWEILTLFPNFILIVLAVERSLAVWFPLKINVFTSVGKAVAGCVVCGLLVLLLTVHNFIIWRVNKLSHCVQTGIDGFYEFYLNVWSKVMPFLFSFVPTILILVLNVIIISGLRKSADVRRLMTAGDDKINSNMLSQSRQVTAMLISISIIFFITNIPYAIFHVFGNIGGWIVLNDDYEQLYTYKHAQSAFLMTFFTMWRDVNHSLNFLCYFLSTRRFREELRNLAVSCRNPFKFHGRPRMPTPCSATGTTS